MFSARSPRTKFFMMEQGQYQITPAVLYINEYAGGTGGAEGIFILSLRLYVYF